MLSPECEGSVIGRDFMTSVDSMQRAHVSSRRSEKGQRLKGHLGVPFEVELRRLSDESFNLSQHPWDFLSDGFHAGVELSERRDALFVLTSNAERGRIVARVEVPSSTVDVDLKPDRAVRIIRDGLSALAGNTAIDPSELRGVGVSFPARVKQTGRFHGMSLRDPVAKSYVSGDRRKFGRRVELKRQVPMRLARLKCPQSSSMVEKSWEGW
jgi:hypothetical protein